MELRRYVHLLRRRILLLALATAVGLAGGYLASNRASKYEAESSIYIGSRQFAAITNAADASAAMNQLTATFAAMVSSLPVATAAIELTHVPRTPAEVASATFAAAVPNTNYIVVAVKDTDPAVAQRLANGVAEGFVAQVQNLEPATGSGAGTPVTSVFQQAALPTSPLPTSTKKDVLLGGLFGLAAGVGAVALLNYLDVSVKNPEDVERISGLPVLGAIPVLAFAGARPTVVPPRPPPPKKGKE